MDRREGLESGDQGGLMKGRVPPPGEPRERNVNDG
jgi:hypothetical protein